MARQCDASLTGWSAAILQFIKDMGVSGWGTKHEEAVNRTAMYDICFRAHMMSEGSGTMPMFPKSCELLAGYTRHLPQLTPEATPQLALLLLETAAWRCVGCRADIA